MWNYINWFTSKSFDYSINNVGLSHINNFKDFGITFNSKYNFNMHITIITNNAKRSSNIILRCFLTQNHNNYIIAFKSYVRPLLEYAYTLWNPYRCGLNNNELIKNVQRYFTINVIYLTITMNIDYAF